MLSNNKMKAVIPIIVFLLIIFIGISSVAWYKYFSRGKFDYLFSGLTLKIKTTDGINNNATSSDGNDDKANFVPYEFVVKNDSTQKKHYSIEIVDLLPGAVSDGCDMNTLLNRKQLKYKLLLNKKVIHEGPMVNIKNNILDSREITKASINHYKLLIWITDQDTDNWVGKHYHYKIELLSN